MTDTLAAQIETLADESNHDDFATRHSARVNLRHLLGDNLPAIVTALRQAEAAQAEIDRLHMLCKANNDLARMNAKDRDEWREKAVRLSEQAEAAPGVVEALERVLSATTLRALRGRDHVPSMREEQDACSQARAALALARQHEAREGYVLVPRVLPIEVADAMTEVTIVTRVGEATTALNWEEAQEVWDAALAMFEPLPAAPATDVGEKA